MNESNLTNPTKFVNQNNVDIMTKKKRIITVF